MRESFAQYLATERNYSPHTLAAYTTDLGQCATFLAATYGIELFSTDSIGTLTHRHIRSWMAHLLEMGISSRSVSRKISALKTYCAFLQRSGWLAVNPVKRITRPKFAKSLPSFLKNIETERLFSLPDIFPATEIGIRDRTLLELLYGCGLRRSEAAALRFGDIDRHNCSLQVIGKGKKARILPYSKPVATAFAAYETIRSSAFAGINLPHSPYFLRPSGRPMSPMDVYLTVRRYLRKICSLPHVGPHTLRHTFATHLLDNGAELNAIKDLLGHESLAATQVYTHNSISKLKNMYQQAHPRATKPQERSPS